MEITDQDVQDHIDSEANRMYSIIDPAHSYQLHNLEGGVQLIEFIKKEPKEEGSTELVTIQNGTTNEAVLEVLTDRLQVLYSRVPSEETKEAISHLIAAHKLLVRRTLERKARNVEGTSAA